MAKRKSTAEELLDLISEICFHLPVWAILLIPIVCGGGSYLAIDYLRQKKGSNAKYKDPILLSKI